MKTCLTSTFVIAGTLCASAVSAATIVLENPTPILSTICDVAGCASDVGEYFGFVFQDLDPFTLNVGDIIAFDTGRPSDVAITFDLSLASIEFSPDFALFPSDLSQVALTVPGQLGDAIAGNYDLLLQVQSPLEFSGGALAVGVLPTSPSLESFTDDGLLLGALSTVSGGSGLGLTPATTGANAGFSPNLQLGLLGANVGAPSNTLVALPEQIAAVPLPASGLLSMLAILTLFGRRLATRLKRINVTLGALCVKLRLPIGKGTC